MDIDYRVVEITFENSENCTNLHLFLNGFRNALRVHIESILSSHSYLKFSLVLSVRSYPSIGRKLIKTKNYLLIYTRQVLESLNNAFEAIQGRFPDKSNSHFHKIINVKCLIYKLYKSPYGGRIREFNLFQPPFLRSKKSCILSIALNKSLANSCFIFAVAAALKKIPSGQKPWRPSHYYDVIQTFDKNSYCNPMPIYMFSKFENNHICFLL